MKLLTEKELIWSAVVANSTMNRSRNATGVNSYQQEFEAQLPELLHDYAVAMGGAKWLDLCCGEGHALIEAAALMKERDVQDGVQFEGLDLVDGFAPIPTGISCLQFKVGSIVDWEPETKYDIITCVHGLHYVGDRLSVIEKACAALNVNGIFFANFDADNIWIDGVKAIRFLKAQFKQHDIEYRPRKKMICCVQPRNLHFGLQYEGANDGAGPNYTGQPSVDAYYSTL